MKPHSLVLIGAGRIARVHARSIARSPRAKLAAVVDPDPSAGAEVAALHGGEAFATLADALKRSSTTGIVIASPTGTHADYIETCVSRGIPVLCEKPVDLTLARVDQCLDRINRSDVPVTIGFHRRADPARREVKAALSNGQIGRPEHVIQISRDLSPPPASFLAHSGGIVRDMLIHDLDELVWMFGDGPLTVTAKLTPFVDPALANLDDYDSAAVTIVYANGPVCHISASRHCSYGFDQRLEVFGSSGLVSCPNMTARRATVATEVGFLRGPLHKSFGERYAAAYEAELEAFLDTVEGLAPPLCPVSDARMSLALAELVMEAHRGGTCVSAASLKRAGDERNVSGTRIPLLSVDLREVTRLGRTGSASRTGAKLRRRLECCAKRFGRRADWRDRVAGRRELGDRRCRRSGTISAATDHVRACSLRATATRRAAAAL